MSKKEIEELRKIIEVQTTILESHQKNFYSIVKSLYTINGTMTFLLKAIDMMHKEIKQLKEENNTKQMKFIN